MYRNHGIPHAFKVAFSADRAKGYLAQLLTDGTLSDSSSNGSGVYFALIEDIKAGDTEVAGATVSGVAKVYVETASGIKPGVRVGVGGTGEGVIQFAGGFEVGIALATPKADGDFIPVLLTHGADLSGY